MTGASKAFTTMTHRKRGQMTRIRIGAAALGLAALMAAGAAQAQETTGRVTGRVTD